jgi:hypothetical protein
MENSRRSFIKKLGLSTAIITGGSSFLKGSFTSRDSSLANKNYPPGNNRVPICLLIDDSAPLIHVYWFHKKPINGKGPSTNDGRLLVKDVPNSFLDRFCDVVAGNKMAGKISIVPSPGGVGDIVNGIPGYDNSLITQWLNTAKTRLSDRFDFSPEMLTHNRALDLKTGIYSEENEAEWSKKQDRTILTPYIINALELLKKAGINATGITSPWNFGKFVENEYKEAMIAAQKKVYNHELSWYFLDTLDNQPEKKPWIALRKENCTLISIASNMPDHFWETIDSPRTDKEYIQIIAEKYITADGKGGSIINVLEAGGWPVFVTHWQSLYSNGLETGLKALDEVGKRISSHLKDKVKWTSCMELTKLTVEL